ncbi:MAG: DUF222 domain-containing protein [Iamia sp.]
MDAVADTEQKKPEPLALDVLDSAGCADLPEAVLVQRLLDLHKLKAEVEGALSATTGAFDAKKAWTADAARSGAGWLAGRVDMGRKKAASEVLLARDLRSMPVVEAAALAGDLGRDKVHLLAKARTPELEEVFADQECFLVGEVVGLTMADAAMFLRAWQARAREMVGWTDPDGPEPPDAPRAAADLSSSFEGRWILDGEFDAEHGAIINSVITAEVDEMFRVGMFTAGDGLTARQRRGLALVQVLVRKGRVGIKNGEIRPSVEIIADAKTASGLMPFDEEDAASRVCEIRDVGPISMVTLGRFLCTANIHGLVFGADGEPLNLGRDVELANRAQRRALRFEHRGCAFPGCSAPASWCEAHHIVWRDKDGPTDLNNLVLLCRFHHHRVHDDGYLMMRGPDGIEVYRPDGTPLTPSRRRRRSHIPDEGAEIVRRRLADHIANHQKAAA